MTNHTKIGTCPHCGAPVWARRRAQGDKESMDGPKPPKAEYSCDCRLAAIPVQTWPTYPQWWQYYEGPMWYSPYYPYKITCGDTTDVYVTYPGIGTTDGTTATAPDYTAGIYAHN